MASPAVGASPTGRDNLGDVAGALTPRLFRWAQIAGKSCGSRLNVIRPKQRSSPRSLLGASWISLTREAATAYPDRWER
jgi:hypothetical protein